MPVLGSIVLVEHPFDDDYEWHLSQGLKVFKITKYTDILTLKHKLGDGYYLFFRNSRIRFNIKEIVSLLNNELDGLNLIKDNNNKVIAFNPQKVKILEGFIDADFPFILNEISWEIPPKIDIPDLYMLVHSRHEYLKLTLNSLLYSFGENEKPLIKIFMDNPTPEVFNLVCEYREKYPKLEWYKSEQNIQFKTIRALMDYFCPKIFLYAEEDFILPPDVLEEYPYWPQQFAILAEKGGYVCWRANNMPIKFSNSHWVSNLLMKPATIPKLDSKWDINFDVERFVAGYMMAIKSSTYLDIDNVWPSHLPAVDHHISASIKFEASPTLSGYHIGYNNCMDYTEYAKKTLPDVHGEITIVDHDNKKHIMRIK